MPLRFSICIEPYEPLSRVIELVKLSEECGFELAWFPDSQMLWKDCYVAMAAAATTTSSIRLGTGVANPYTRHPTVTAMAAMTLDELAPGRIVIGYGQGDSSVRNLGLKPTSLTTLREATELMRAMTKGKTITFGDKSMKFDSSHEIPIYLGGTGPKTLRLAGELGDGVIVNVGTERRLLRYGIENVRQGAEQSGRDPRSVDMACWAACSINPNRESAYDDVKRFASWFPHAAPLPSELVPYAASGSAQSGVYDYSAHMARNSPQEKVATKELIDAFTLSGDLEECLDKIEVIKSSGISHLAVYLLAKDKEYVIRTFGESIIPNFR